MSLSKKRRSGKKGLGLTRNQRRKKDYAEMQANQVGESRPKKSRNTGRTGVHVHPCGNLACEECYEHTPGVGFARKV